MAFPNFSQVLVFSNLTLSTWKFLAPPPTPFLDRLALRPLEPCVWQSMAQVCTITSQMHISLFSNTPLTNAAARHG